MPRNGFSRERMQQVAAAIRAWPGNWSMDLVGDVLAPAIVLIAEAGDRFGPALHIEHCDYAFRVVAVRWDEIVPVGEYAELDTALEHLGTAISAGASQLGSARLN